MTATSPFLNRRLRSELEAERDSARNRLDRAHMAQIVVAGGVNAIVASLREIEMDGDSYADALHSLTAGAYDAVSEIQGLKIRAAFEAQVDPEPEPTISGRPA